MDGDDGTVTITNPTVVKAAQEEMGRLDVLVCGQCHTVFHFIEDFQEHKNKDSCTKMSHFRDNGNNEQKAQVWAFLLWKDSQIQLEGTDRDSANSWKLYQKWCKMEPHVRETWVTAGKTIQTFVKMSNTKMTEMTRPTPAEVGKQPVRKVIRNGQPEEPIVDSPAAGNKEAVTKSDVKSADTSSTQPAEKRMIQARPKTYVKPRVKPGKTAIDGEPPNEEEFPVEKIMAKRYNTKKRCPEYYLKWEGYGPEFNTWESADVINTCKYLLEEFERNLAKQKEMKELKAQQMAAQQQQQQQQQLQQQQQQQLGTKVVRNAIPVKPQAQVKPEPSKPGPSTAAQVVAGRPMRSSKSKAMDQVKQWCGSMKEEDGDMSGKRRGEFTDSDSDEVAAKKPKVEACSDEEWTGDSDEERMSGRSDMIQRAFNRATGQSNGSNKADLINSSEVTKVLHQSPVLVANAKGVMKVDPKQLPNLASGLYVMTKKEGMIKLDSSPSSKLAVKGSAGTQNVLMVQNREATTIVRKQVMTQSQANSITPVKVVSKPDGSQLVTQMKVITKPVTQAKPRPSLGMKGEPVKIQPKPDPTQISQIHVVATMPTQVGIPRTATPIRPSGLQQKPGESRPLLPRPAVRGAAPTGVLGVAGVRSPVRAPVPKVQINQQQRPTIQKRIIATSQSPTTITTQQQQQQQSQVRTKYTVVTQTSGNQVVKTVNTGIVKQSPKTPNKPSQSLLSPQQKLLMAKRKAQEAAGIVKTPTRSPIANTKVMPGRGRGKVSNVVIPPMIGKPKETKIVESDSLHMEFQEVGSDDSSEEAEPEVPVAETLPSAQAEPESPPRPFTLCPLTGRIMGPDGEPMETATEPEPEPQVVVPASTIATVTSAQAAGITATATSTATPTELVLPSLDALTESGGIMRVEMSPGGTTGTIIQGSSDATAISIAGVTVAAPDLPCLDDSAVTSSSPVAATVAVAPTIASEPAVATSAGFTATISTSSMSPIVPDIKQEIKQEQEERRVDETSNLVTITGEDGVIYQVAGHAEDGQTVLVTRGEDGEQQCVYVTTEQSGIDGSVLTLDNAVAEAVAAQYTDQSGMNLAPQFYVNEGEGAAVDGQMVMSIMDNSGATAAAGQEDPDSQAQVVAQVVQADDPTPGGTRRVVLLLPDGNLMMTEVDEEQYAALELDK